MSDTAWVLQEEIDKIGDLFRQGARIDCTLSTGVRLHIDRPQPFLCLYRTPPGQSDPDTELLLGGLASYLIVPGKGDDETSLKELIKRILNELSQAFGTAALLELSTIRGEAAGATSSGVAMAPALRLTAPRQGAPVKSLETFEKAVAATAWPLARPGVDIQYAVAPHAPRMPPLLTEAEAKELNTTLLSLEISPFFRDVETGELYPDVLRDLRAALGHVLKQTLYSFCLTTAAYRPVHYHELGPQAVTDHVWAVDKSLSEISDAFDLLLYVTPVNADEAFHEFQAHKFGRDPEFHYRPLRVDPSALKRQLFSIPLEEIDDPALHQLFVDKREELDKQLSLLTDRGTERFRFGSLQIFGEVDDELLALARALLEKIPAHARGDNVTDAIGASEFADRARTELNFYRQSVPQLGAQVFVRDDIPGLLVSNGDLLIGSQSQIARSRVEATLHHEVGTHILTYHNGRMQPFQQLHSGLARYEELQEGLAVFSEFLVGGLSRPRLRHLAGRVIAVHAVSTGAGFVDTYRLLHEDYDFNQRIAYSTAMRVHRGGGYVKDAVYLRGLTRILDYLGQDGSFDTLLIGKIGFQQIGVLEELQWRKVLSADILRPRYLEQPEVGHRFARVLNGLSVLDMLDGALT